MPTGVFVDCLAVAVGGVLGALLKNVLPKRLVDNLPVYFGFSAVCMGIASIIKLNSLIAVVGSVLIGGVIGELLKIEDGVKALVTRALPVADDGNGERIGVLTISIAIFCFSGTGIYGALAEGMTGDATILYSRAILTFLTALIFAVKGGYAVSLIALPQLAIMLGLFFLARYVSLYLNDAVIGNFMAVGGVITTMIGVSLLKLRELKVMNAVPALLIVIPLSFII